MSIKSVPKYRPPKLHHSGATVQTAIQRPASIGYATTSYKACGGTEAGIGIDPSGNNGIMAKQYERKPVSFSHVPDGLSNTLMVAESTYVTGNNSARHASPGSATPNNPGTVENWPIWIGASDDDEGSRVTGEFSKPDQCRCKSLEWFFALGDDSAASYHTGGANFVFADGLSTVPFRRYRRCDIREIACHKWMANRWAIGDSNARQLPLELNSMQ